MTFMKHSMNILSLEATPYL